MTFLRLSIQWISWRIHRTFVANQTTAVRIGEQLGYSRPLAVDFHCVADQPYAVAVVDVAVPMDDRERLDRLAARLPPAVDREPVGLLEDSRRENDVLFDAGD